VTEIARLLEANQRYADTRDKLDGRQPRRHLAVVTCIDTRIDPLDVLGLELGEAVVLRNAGARVTDDVLRTLAVSTHVLGVDTVVLMQHTTCGLTDTTDDELRARTGAELDFLVIDDHGSTLRTDVDRLARIPYLASITSMAGLLYDLDSGLVDQLVAWERAAP
jgi:carbonic anhydrase